MAPKIRAVSLADVPAMLAIYAPIVEETTISWEYEPPSQDQFGARVNKVLAAGFPWLVLVDADGVLAGYAYASDYRDRYAYRFCCESSIYMRADSRGKGWGRMLYKALLDVLSAQGYVSVIGGMGYPNPASEALHLGLGFERVGLQAAIGYKFGSWHDLCLMQRDLRPKEQPIAERPLQFEEVSLPQILSTQFESCT